VVSSGASDLQSHSGSGLSGAKRGNASGPGVNAAGSEQGRAPPGVTVGEGGKVLGSTTRRGLEVENKEGVKSDTQLFYKFFFST
jgi:hypothetical protein